jgi:hypothetical protein
VEKGGGEELELGCDREENGEKRERVALDGFSSALVMQGSEGKKEGGPPATAAWQREKEERGPRAWWSALSRNRGERRGAADAVQRS